MPVALWIVAGVIGVGGLGIGVAYVVLGKLEPGGASQAKETAKLAVDKMVGEVTLFQRNNPDVDCPTVDQIRRASPRDRIDGVDPWGSSYRISCEGDSVVVISKGPDKKENTPDDIRSDTAATRSR